MKSLWWARVAAGALGISLVLSGLPLLGPLGEVDGAVAQEGSAPGIPVQESAARVKKTTAWGPPANSGLECTWSGPTVCQVEISLELAPGWADWQSQMAQAGVSHGRISIADGCPSDARSAYSTEVVLNAQDGSAATKVTIGCDYGKYYTIPSLHVPWKLEWYDASMGTWVDGGGQIPIDQLQAQQFPGLDVSEYEARLSGIALAELCLPYALVPGNSGFTSLPDAYRYCDALVRAGTYTLGAILAALAVKYGIAALDELVVDTDRDTDPKPIPLPPLNLPPSGNAEIANALMSHDATLTSTEGEQVARRCRELVARKELPSILDGSGVPRHPCSQMRMFIPGSDAQQAASHKLQSIYATPEWVVLTNASQAMTEARMEADGFDLNDRITWRQQVPTDHKAFTSVDGTPCGSSYDATTLECDEYPYFASRQGGPYGPPQDPSAWTGFTLDLISRADNEREGQAYQGFKTDPECGLQDPATQQAIPDVPFLVVPMPEGPTSRHLCPVG